MVYSSVITERINSYSENGQFINNNWDQIFFLLSVDRNFCKIEKQQSLIKTQSKSYYWD